MEIELKYTIESEAVLSRMLEDTYFLKLSDGRPWQEVPMKAAYYDTKEKFLDKSGVALRIRKEGDRQILTLKFSGNQEAGLHKREEINIEVKDALPEGHIKAFIETDFIRHILTVEKDNLKAEIAIDQGRVTAGGRFEKVIEVEIELIEGDEKALLALGEEIKARYGLYAENKTKYSRGLRLLGQSL